MSLLQIKIAGVSVPIPSTTSFTFNEETPVLSHDFTGGEFSWYFELPNTPEVNQLLVYPHLPDSKTPRKLQIPCSLILMGTHWKSGLLTVKSSIFNHRCYFQSGVSSALAGSMEKSMREMQLTSYNIAGDMYDHALATVNNHLDFDYTFFPLHCPDYSDNPDFGKVINRFDIDNVEFYKNAGYLIEGNPRFSNILSPFMRATTVYIRLLESLGYTVDAPIFKNDATMRRAFIPSPFALDAEIEHPVDPGYIMMPRNEFTMQEFLPDIQVQHFISIVNDLFGVLLFVDEYTKTAHIVSRSNAVTNSKMHVFKGKVFGREMLHEDQNDLYFRHTAEDPEWIPEDRDQLIETKMVLLNMIWQKDQQARAYVSPSQPLVESIIPAVDYTMNDNGKEDFSLVLFDGLKEMITDVSRQQVPVLYPQAHTHIRRGSFLKVDELTIGVGNIKDLTESLDWARKLGSLPGVPVPPPGYVAYLYKNWEDWWHFYRRAKPVKYNVVPTAEDIQNIHFDTDLRIDNQTLLLRKITTTVFNNHVICEVEGFIK